jgi:hypothetical protein
MKNSSVVLVSSQSSSKILKECFESLINLAEHELWVSVEFIHGFDSFWVPTPKEELSALSDIGIIDIGDDQEMIHKIGSLAHEIGHVLHDQSRLLSPVQETMFSETIAWILGYNWCLDRGVEIEKNEYQAQMLEALMLYKRELEWI